MENGKPCKEKEKEILDFLAKRAGCVEMCIKAIDIAKPRYSSVICSVLQIVDVAGNGHTIFMCNRNMSNIYVVDSSLLSYHSQAYSYKAYLNAMLKFVADGGYAYFNNDMSSMPKFLIPSKVLLPPFVTLDQILIEKDLHEELV